MSIGKAVEEAQACFNMPPPNESNTCEWVILPLLYAAGYERSDVTSRFVDNNRQFPDYTVLKNDPSHTWYVEAKSWSYDLTAAHAHQARITQIKMVSGGPC